MCRETSTPYALSSPSQSNESEKQTQSKETATKSPKMPNRALTNFIQYENFISHGLRAMGYSIWEPKAIASGTMTTKLLAGIRHSDGTADVESTTMPAIIAKHIT